MGAANSEGLIEVKTDRNGFVRCRVCGCTEVDACPGGCGWADGDLCTICFAAAEELREWRENSRRPNLTALLREAEMLPAVPRKLIRYLRTRVGEVS